MEIRSKKRVLYFIPEFTVYSETFIEREVSKLIERGNINLLVLSLKKGSSFDSFKYKDNVVFKRLDLFNFILGFPALFTASLAIKKVFDLASDDTSMSFVKKILLVIKSIGYARIFRQYFPIDHIHIHFFSEFSTIGMFSAIILNIPFSISGHAADIFVNGHMIRQKIDNSEFVTVCNLRAWEKCREISNLPHKIKLIYHGYEKVREDTPPSFQRPDYPLILHVARLVEKKGTTYLIQALNILNNKGIHFHALIVGSGPLYGHLLQEIQNYNLKDVVTIKGWNKGLPHPEVINYYKISSVFVLPNIESSEGDVDGLPNSIVEAGFYKVPIVTTNAGSTTDFINEERGILVPQKDPSALAAAIEKILTEHDFALSVSNNAYNYAQVKLNLEANIKQLEELFL